MKIGNTVFNYQLSTNSLLYSLGGKDLIILCLEFALFDELMNFWNGFKYEKPHKKSILLNTSDSRCFIFLKIISSKTSEDLDNIYTMITLIKSKLCLNTLRILKNSELERLFFFFIHKFSKRPIFLKFNKRRLTFHDSNHECVSNLSKINFTWRKVNLKKIIYLTNYAKLRNINIFILCEDTSNQRIRFSFFLTSDSYDKITKLQNYIKTLSLAKNIREKCPNLMDVKNLIRKEVKNTSNNIRYHEINKLISLMDFKTIFGHQIISLPQDYHTLLEELVNEISENKNNLIELDDSCFLCKNSQVLLIYVKKQDYQILYRALDKYYMKYWKIIILFKLPDDCGSILANTQISLLKKIIILKNEERNRFLDLIFCHKQENHIAVIT